MRWDIKYRTVIGCPDCVTMARRGVSVIVTCMNVLNQAHCRHLLKATFLLLLLPPTRYASFALINTKWRQSCSITLGCHFTITCNISLTYTKLERVAHSLTDIKVLQHSLQYFIVLSNFRVKSFQLPGGRFKYNVLGVGRVITASCGGGVERVILAMSY